MSHVAPLPVFKNKNRKKTALASHWSERVEIIVRCVSARFVTVVLMEMYKSLLVLENVRNKVDSIRDTEIE